MSWGRLHRCQRRHYQSYQRKKSKIRVHHTYSGSEIQLSDMVMGTEKDIFEELEHIAWTRRNAVFKVKWSQDLAETENDDSEKKRLACLRWEALIVDDITKVKENCGCIIVKIQACSGYQYECVWAPEEATIGCYRMHVQVRCFSFLKGSLSFFLKSLHHIAFQSPRCNTES